MSKDKWNNLTSKAKCTFTEYKKEANKPDGGPASGIEGGLKDDRVNQWTKWYSEFFKYIMEMSIYSFQKQTANK